MLKYLVILLDDTAVSYCHYGNPQKGRRLIDIDILNDAIKFGMKENLMIQFVYPDYELPSRHLQAIETIDHINVKPARTAASDDIAVCADWLELASAKADIVILRTRLGELPTHSEELVNALRVHKRVNVIISDLEDAKEQDINVYRDWLAGLIPSIKKLFADENLNPQLNLLTDRLTLDSMNNCNAGHESVTIAPDGNFYVCPAFYLDGSRPSGNIKTGLDIRNPQLYKLDHAPICRECDAWQCHRCVWLNKAQTLEVNTPGREQCLVSHHERNASRMLLSEIRRYVPLLASKEIPQINYLDPFDKKQQSNNQ